MQPWYTNDSGYGGSFYHLQSNLEDIIIREISRGYLPDTTKRVLVVSERKIPRYQVLLRSMELQVVMGRQ